MQRNFDELALPGQATTALASTSPQFFAIEKISRTDVPLVRRQNIGNSRDNARLSRSSPLAH